MTWYSVFDPNHLSSVSLCIPTYQQSATILITLLAILEMTQDACNLSIQTGNTCTTTDVIFKKPATD